jgi:hypothetical protein
MAGLLTYSSNDNAFPFIHPRLYLTVALLSYRLSQRIQ